MHKKPHRSPFSLLENLPPPKPRDRRSRREGTDASPVTADTQPRSARAQLGHVQPREQVAPLPSHAGSCLPPHPRPRPGTCCCRRGCPRPPRLTARPGTRLDRRRPALLGHPGAPSPAAAHAAGRLIVAKMKFKII